MNAVSQFIIVDDDINNNYLCGYIIRSVAKDMDILEFTNADDGLKHLIQTGPPQSGRVLFLDLKMPIVDGWGFLIRYEQLPEEIRKLTRIFIVSSSIDPADKERAAANPLVSGYVVKPLTKATVQNILTGLL